MKSIKEIEFLLKMLVIGSILGIENSQASGCNTGLDMLTISNVILFSVSFSLLYYSYKTVNNRTRTTLILCESTIWFLKYFFYKGGYTTGFGGTPNIINILYDFTAIAIRSFIIIKILYQLKKELLISIVIAAILTSIKIKNFSYPWYSKKLNELHEQKTQSHRTAIIGKYSGYIRSLSDDRIVKININIDNEFLIIKNQAPFGLNNNYHFNMYSQNFGSISSSKSSSYSIELEESAGDSIIMLFTDMNTPYYEMRLKKSDKYNPANSN